MESSPSHMVFIAEGECRPRARAGMAGMGSSVPTFVPGPRQPPPKSGCVPVCPGVPKAFPDGPIRKLANQKPAFGNPT
jgi:hypothetical protein